MNSAQRIISIYESLQSQKADQSMAQVWSRVLFVPLGRDASEDEITESLLDLRAEIDLVKSKLEEQKCPQVLLQPGFDRLKDTASATYLNQQFSGLRNNLIAPECGYAFHFAVWMFRDDVEDDFDNEKLKEIQAIIDGLESKINNAEIPLNLRVFLQKHIKALNRATRRSKVLGAKAAVDAYKAARVDMVLESKSLEADINKAEKSAPGIVTDFCEAVEKVGVICDATTKIATALPHLQTFTQLLFN